MINMFLQKYKEKSMTYVIGLLIIEFSFESIFECKNVFINNGYSLFHFVVLYMLSNCLSYYKHRINKIKIIRWIIMYFLCALTVCLLNFTSYKHTWAYSNPVIILESFAFFFIFLSFNINNKKINEIAKSTFSVFILHCLSPIINCCVKVDLYLNSNYNFISYFILVIIFIIIVYAVCIFIDMLRIKLISPYFDRMGYFLTKKLNKHFIYD